MEEMDRFSVSFSRNWAELLLIVGDSIFPVSRTSRRLKKSPSYSIQIDLSCHLLVYGIKKPLKSETFKGSVMW
jgi:hypothetical protein